MSELNEGKLAEILDQASRFEEMGDKRLNNGDLEKSKEHYLQGLHILEESGFPFDSIGEKKGLLVYSLAIALMRLEELEEAFKQFHETIDIFNRLDSYPAISASSYYNLGILVRAREEYELAVEHFQKALKIWSDYQDEKNVKDSLEALGDTYRYSGHPEEAVKWYQGWLDLIDKEMPPEEAVQPLRDLGAVYSDSNELEKAVDAYLEAIKLYEGTDNPNPSTLGSLYLSLGNAYSNSGEYTKTIEAQLIRERKVVYFNRKPAFGILFAFAPFLRDFLLPCLQCRIQILLIIVNSQFLFGDGNAYTELGIGVGKTGIQ